MYVDIFAYVFCERFNSSSKIYFVSININEN